MRRMANTLFKDKEEKHISHQTISLILSGNLMEACQVPSASQSDIKFDYRQMKENNKTNQGNHVG